jgi:hypothetical protein
MHQLCLEKSVNARTPVYETWVTEPGTGIIYLRSENIML